jgi:hypothetical protein
MIDLLLDEIKTQLNNFLQYKSTTIPFVSQVADIALHDKDALGGEDEGMGMAGSIIISLVSIEEEASLKNNYPLRQIGSALVKEKSSIFINAYILFSAKYDKYDTALKAIANVVLFFQSTRRVRFFADGEMQEAILNLHNIGFENLNNLWTVLGGKYLPSVMYKARVLMYQASPPEGAAVVLDIQEKENLS